MERFMIMIFFFDTPDLGYCSTLFLTQVEHVQMSILLYYIYGSISLPLSYKYLEE